MEQQKYTGESALVVPLIFGFWIAVIIGVVAVIF